LSSPQLPEKLHLRALVVAKMKVTHPFGLTLNYSLCGPCIAHQLFLWSGESINVRAMVSDEDEELQVAHNELRLVSGADRALDLLQGWLGGNVVEWGKFRRIEKEGLFFWKRRVVHEFL
jgi:hypothetical protein